MKNYLLRVSGIAALAVLLSMSVTAQETKDKDKEKDKNKMSKTDEIIIVKKGDKDAKITIEVKDGEVTVNGQPLDQYKGDDITVRRGRNLNGTRVFTPSPFSGQTWSYSDDAFSEHAYLGVTTDRDDKGARITSVTDKSAAEKAGLKEGDVIIRVDDTKIEDHDDLSKAIRKHKPEDKVTVTYLRDGKEQKATATLGKTGGSYSLNYSGPQMEMLNDNFNGTFGQGFSYNARPRLGLKAQDTEDGKGVKVLSVDEGSAADKAGIQKDDVITEFNGKEVNSADELANAARSAKDKNAMSVKLNRAGKSQTIDIKIPKKLKTANL
jgi:serine protease Do